MRSFSCVVKWFPVSFLNSWVSICKIISIRDEFSSNDFISTAHVLVLRLSFEGFLRTPLTATLWLMSDHGARLRWKDQLGANLNPARQHSLWEETRVPGENPRLSTERWLTLFKQVSWVWSEDQEVKGAYSDHDILPWFSWVCYVLF